MNDTSNEQPASPGAPAEARRVFIWAACLAAVFLGAHLSLLPPTLEDIDSLNFALGMRDFDPVRGQPHAPGYPVFIALAKLARPLAGSEPAALAVWGAIFGAIAVFALMGLFSGLEQCHRSGRLDGSRGARPALATLVVVACPLFWFTALRPLSDVPGLAAALLAQACLVTAFVRQRAIAARGAAAIAESGRMIVLGALIAGLGIGVRTQVAWLTLPLLALVLLHRAGRGAAGAVLGSAITFSAGVLVWAVPLVAASGGLGAYRHALALQAAEDFSGVDMLVRNPSLRRFAVGVLQTLILPWAVGPLGYVVLALALLGFLVVVWRSPAAGVLVAVMAVPYGLFTLAFQESVTTRYALPLVPVVGYLAVRGAWALGRRQGPLAVAGIVLASAVLTLPAAAAYGRNPSPVFAAIGQIKKDPGVASRTPGEPPVTIGMHQMFARAVQTEDFGSARVLAAPPMREWLELAAYWLGGGRAPVWFLADPARTDLELIDPQSRQARFHYEWSFPRLEFMSGVRPDILDIVRIESPPAWFCAEGWHLTPETLGMSEKRPRDEAVAHVRRRPEPAILVLGGQQMGGAGEPPARLSVAIDGRVIDQWSLAPGQTRFFRRWRLAAGELSGDPGLARLVVSYGASAGNTRAVRLRLTQFAVEPEDSVFGVLHEGWHDFEYSASMQRRWRWSSDRAVTFVNSGGRDVDLAIEGESPMRYFTTAPRVVVRAGTRVLAERNPTTDFSWRITVPAAALQESDGAVTLETSQSFVPGDQSRSPDRRRLGLRIFRFEVAPARQRPQP